MNFQTMSKQRKFILIAAVIGIISVFLPWATVSIGMFGESASESVNGFHGVGIIVFLAFIIAAIVTLTGDQTKALDKTTWMVALIAAAAALLFAVIALANTSHAGLGFVDAGFGFGIWLTLAAAIGVGASAWLFRNPADDLKSGFDDLKKKISTSTAPQSPATNTGSGSNKIAELEKLSKLRESGSITEEEYQQLKSKVL